MSYNLKEVEKYVVENQSHALSIASSLLEKEISVQSFNGIIGGKNASYKVNINDYSTADEYFDAWINNHNLIYELEKNLSYDKSSHRVHKLLEDEFLYKYINMFLIRTYLRKMKK